MTPAHPSWLLAFPVKNNSSCLSKCRRCSANLTSEKEKTCQLLLPHSRVLESCRVMRRFFRARGGPVRLSAVLCRHTRAIAEHASSGSKSRPTMLIQSCNQAVSPPEKQDKPDKGAWLLIQNCCSFVMCYCTALCRYPLTYKPHLFG